jgi:hypothetical protein
LRRSSAPAGRRDQLSSPSSHPSYNTPSSSSSAQDRASRVRTFNLPFPHRSSFAIRFGSLVRPPPYASRHSSAVKKRATGITACGMRTLLLTLGQLGLAYYTCHFLRPRVTSHVVQVLTTSATSCNPTLSVLRVARYSRSDLLAVARM